MNTTLFTEVQELRREPPGGHSTFMNEVAMLPVPENSARRNTRGAKPMSTYIEYTPPCSRQNSSTPEDPSYEYFSEGESVISRQSNNQSNHECPPLVREPSSNSTAAANALCLILRGSSTQAQRAHDASAHLPRCTIVKSYEMKRRGRGRPTNADRAAAATATAANAASPDRHQVVFQAALPAVSDASTSGSGPSAAQDSYSTMRDALSRAYHELLSARWNLNKNGKDTLDQAIAKTNEALNRGIEYCEKAMFG